MRKAKADLKLDLVRDANDNKKGLFEYFRILTAKGRRKKKRRMR